MYNPRGQVIDKQSIFSALLCKRTYANCQQVFSGPAAQHRQQAQPFSCNCCKSPVPPASHVNPLELEPATNPTHARAGAHFFACDVLLCMRCNTAVSAIDWMPESVICLSANPVRCVRTILHAPVMMGHRVIGDRFGAIRERMASVFWPRFVLLSRTLRVIFVIHIIPRIRRATCPRENAPSANRGVILRGSPIPNIAARRSPTSLLADPQHRCSPIPHIAARRSHRSSKVKSH